MNNEVASILEAIKIHAKETPDKLCAGDKKKSATYSEFWDMIQRAATYLKNSGVRKDSIVVIRGVQKVEYLVAALGIQLAGAAYLPRAQRRSAQCRVLRGPDAALRPQGGHFCR